MNIDSLPILYKAGEVRRFHTMRVLHPQDIAAHSWGVALVLLWLYAEDMPSAALLRAAIIHDMPEQETGDHPGHIKWQDDALCSALERRERWFLNDHGISEPTLDETERTLLAFADSAEGVWFCITEVTMGNKRMLDIADRWLKRMYDLLSVLRGYKRTVYLCENLSSLVEELRK